MNYLYFKIKIITKNYRHKNDEMIKYYYGDDNMKKKFLTKLKIWLCIIIAILVIICVFVIINYNNDPIAFQNQVNSWAEQIESYVNGINNNKKSEPAIVLPEKEDLSNARKYFYFEQLSDTAKVIYVTIENNVDKLLNGEDNIPLPSSLNDFAQKNGKEKVAEEFQNAWDAFITDKCEYFYLDSSKVCLISKITTKATSEKYEFFIGKGDNKTYFIDEFKTKEQVEKAIEEISEVEEKILKNATGTNYDKMLYVHDWIIENAEYEAEHGENTANIYGCLVDEKALCEGYARTFKYLLDKLNIPCILVSGDAVDESGKTERHAWNYVFINNNWYAIDATWDDPIIIGNGSIKNNKKYKYKYFLKGKKTMDEDHTPLGRITKGGITFEYPELCLDDFE